MPSEVKAMLRDQTEDTMDMKILENMQMDVLNMETVHANRSSPVSKIGQAIREALANCLVNTDFYLPRGIVIKKDVDSIIMKNPGSIRTGKKQMLRGGISDPRNKALMKMLNMIGIGERAGSGVPDIYSVW